MVVVAPEASEKGGIFRDVIILNQTATACLRNELLPAKLLAIVGYCNSDPASRNREEQALHLHLRDSCCT